MDQVWVILHNNSEDGELLKGAYPSREAALGDYLEALKDVFKFTIALKDVFKSTIERDELLTSYVDDETGQISVSANHWDVVSLVPLQFHA